MASTPQRWFPNAIESTTPALQRIFQRILTYIYTDEAQIAALQALTPTTDFPVHFNSIGTVGTSAFNPATGDQFFCYATNKWVRLGPSGTSTTF